NGLGQLGNGTTTNSSLPVAVSNLTGVTAIAGGGYAGYALVGDWTGGGW
ncbi:RCC1 domain-containing protein, partial [Frankia sp. Cppng1_Ct_nod]